MKSAKSLPETANVLAMAKAKVVYRCNNCGYETGKWVGQCRECGEWSTMEEGVSLPPSAARAPQSLAAPLAPGQAAKPISEVSASSEKRRPSGIAELDRVLGGGIVPGAVILLTGEPGIGKSTLLLEVAAKVASAAAGTQVLYVTGEESAAQVRLRAGRIGALDPNVLLAAETDVQNIIGHAQTHHPALLIVDSVQTLTHTAVEGGAGGVAQVRACAQALIQMAKAQDLPVLLVGHVTKDGNLAGPRVLEHLVDVVCHFEGERHAQLRLLRALKNRYGATDEVGCFEMRDDGVKGLEDPSGLFIEELAEGVPGSCVCVTLEGRRPLATQVQALVANSSGGSPRRTTSGVDHSRLAMTLAVLQARAGVDLSSRDVYAGVVGGAKISEPAADLALAVALTSSQIDRPCPADLVAFGEVSLTGMIRSVPGSKRRLSEAARLGFKFALVPDQGFDPSWVPVGMRVKTVRTLTEALHSALQSS